MALACPLERLLQPTHFLLSPDRWRQAPVSPDLHPGPPVDFPLEGVRAGRLTLALELELTQVLEEEHLVPQLLCALTDHDLAGLGNAKESRRQIRRVAYRGVVHAE